MDDGWPGFRRPGVVPKNAAFDLSGLRSRSLFQNQCCSAAIQLDSLSKLDDYYYYYNNNNNASVFLLRRLHSDGNERVITTL